MLQDSWNCFDFIIVLLSLVELLAEGVNGLSMLRSFRLLRYWRSQWSIHAQILQTVQILKESMIYPCSDPSDCSGIEGVNGLSMLRSFRLLRYWRSQWSIHAQILKTAQVLKESMVYPCSDPSDCSGIEESMVYSCSDPSDCSDIDQFQMSKTFIKLGKT